MANFPTITFKGDRVDVLGETEATVTGDLTIRGITRSVPLRVRYLGQWQTPWWEDGVDKGPKTRAGFTATTTIDRHDFDVRWNAPLDGAGTSSVTSSRSRSMPKRSWMNDASRYL